MTDEKKTNPSDDPAHAANIDAAIAAAVASGESEPRESATVDLAGEVERLRVELSEARDRLLRERAELDNFRKRSRRELEDERRYANLPLLRDIVPVIDNMERALEAAKKTAEASPLLEGFRMVAQQFEDVLKKHHCVRIAALGEPFDPHRHEAILQQPSEEHAPNTVVGVGQTGFLLHDRVVRPVQVIVSKSPESN